MKHKVIFLDRDGTINEEVNYLHRPEDLRIIPGVPAALKRLRELGFLLVLITNQAGIGRGYYTEADCEKLNEFLNEELRKQGAELDAAYYCPHHPEKGVGNYKMDCSCRKPGIGMFLQAEMDLRLGKFGSEESRNGKALWQSPLRLSDSELSELKSSPESAFAIDRAHSFMLGDKRIDAAAGRAFSVKGILLGSGYGKTEHELSAAGELDGYFDSMEEAVRWIEKQEQKDS